MGEPIARRRRYPSRAVQGGPLIGIHTPEFPPYAGEQGERRAGAAEVRDRIPSFVLIDKKENIRYEGYGEFRVGDASDRLWSERIEKLITVSLMTTVGMSLLLACSGTRDPAAPLRVEYSPAGDSTRLTLIPSAGIRINARLKPALELPDGTVLRFDSPRLTADSAYFAELPSALIAGPRKDVTGTLRASICGDEPACRGVVLEL